MPSSEEIAKRAKSLADQATVFRSQAYSTSDYGTRQSLLAAAKALESQASLLYVESARPQDAPKSKVGLYVVAGVAALGLLFLLGRK